MAKSIRVVAAAMLLVGMSAIAVAQTDQTRSGVTVLRGNTQIRSGNSIGTGTGDPASPAPAGRPAIDQSGAINALHTGSSSAGGEIANPPPGAGR